MDYLNEEDQLTKEYDSKLMMRLLKFTKPFIGYFILALVLVLLATSLDLVRPYLTKDAIDNYMQGYKKPYTLLEDYKDGAVKIDGQYVIKGKVSSGKEVKIINSNKDYYLVYGNVDADKKYKIYGDSIIQGQDKVKAHKLTYDELKELRKDDAHAVERYALYMLIISVCIFVTNYAQVYILQYIGQKIVYSLRASLFEHIESLSLSFFDKNPVGRLVTRVTNDVETINDMYTGVLVYLFRDLFLLVEIIIIMLFMSVKLALIVLATLPIILIITMIFKKYDREAYREVRAKISKINSSLSENISGVKTVQIYHKEKKKFKEFDAINKEYLDASDRQITVFAVFRPAMDLISSLALAFLIWFGAKKVMNASLEIGVLFAFVNYLSKFFQPIFDLTEKYDVLQSSMASSERIFNLLDNDDIVKNPLNPVKTQRFKGKIEFKHVWFAYNNEDWVLRDVDFSIEPGEKVAFVGATGAGKTSIISLITRLYDIQKGEILIDGVNIKDMDKHELRKNLATVLQDVFLFTGDIKSNVRLNNTEISDNDIVKACKYVNADSFINKLSDKYDSYVNERGSTFSQGERQLIAFARAIAFDPPILVLDEATSNIDTETEALIQDALEKITKGRTTLIVAHRLSTIKSANKIIVLHKGKIREMGNHEELLEKQGLYYNLYRMQYGNVQ